MRQYAHLLDWITPELQQAMLLISFQDVEDGLQEAKPTVARHTTKLADDKHPKLDGELFQQADGLDVFVEQVRTAIRTLENQFKESPVRLGALQMQRRSAIIALETSQRK